MDRHKLIPLLSVVLVSLTASKVIAHDHEYSLRGKGSVEERFEGVISKKTAGGLALLSFIRLPKSLGTAGERIFLRFWTPQATEAYLYIQEIHQKKSYQLNATRSSWNKETNEFSWPIDEVIEPLQVNPDDLGVVISSRKYGGSGKVFPASIFRGEAPATTNSYQVTIRSKYTCTPLTWTLGRVTGDSEKPVGRDLISTFPSEEPRSVTLNFDLLAEGLYRLRMRCDRKGHGSGSGSESSSRRTYTFYHRKI